MRGIQRLLQKRREKGASMVEYGILVAAIAAICIAVAFAIGSQVNNAFEDVNVCLNNPNDANC